MPTVQFYGDIFSVEGLSCQVTREVDKKSDEYRTKIDEV